MRVKSKVNVRIYDDANEKDILFAPDDVRAEVINSNHQEWAGGKFVIAPSGNLVLPLGTVGTVRGIYIRTITDFDLSLNGNPAINVLKSLGTAAADPVKFYLDGTLASAQVTNVSAAVNLEGYYAVWGDPV